MPEAALDRSRKRLGGMAVLVVEDDLDSREMLGELLEAQGAVVRTAEGGRAAFDSFVRERPDLVVSDLRMPDGDGYELVQRIRALPEDGGKLTPAIALSASENARPAILAGYHAFVAKPVDVDALVDVMEDFVRVPDTAHTEAAWTISVPAPGRLEFTLVGHVGAAEMRRFIDALLVHLEHGPVDLVDDLRRLTSFSPSAGSFAERGAWRLRHNIRSVRVIGGSALARYVSAASCKVLGIPCTFSDTPDGETRDKP